MQAWTPPQCEIIPENIPQPLKDLDRWVMWKWEPKKDPTKKWDKPPRQPSGAYAASNDPSTWSTFEDALAAYQIEAKWDGIGIVLPPNVVGVDLDDCVVDRELDINAQLCVSQMDTYTEYSPSGTGIKMVAAGKLNEDLPRGSHAKGMELYDDVGSRYFTITGQVVGEPKGIHARREGIHFLQSILADPIRDFDPSQEEIDATTAEVLEYVKHLSPKRADERYEWLAVGMVLHSIDENLFDVWHEFSQRGEKYESEEYCRTRWEGFNQRTSGRLVTAATLKRYAIEDGFRPNRYSTQAITGDQLCAKVITREYIVRNMLVRGEPMVIGGASKSLKTSIALDLAVSVATGKAFLGKFDVPIPRSVMMLSGESGEFTTQENLQAIAASKKLRPGALSRLHVGFKLPKLDDPGQVADLLHDLKERQTEIVIIDPLYRSLRAGDAASNIFAMGEQLELISEQIHRAGITPILLHHFRKQGRTYDEPPELEDLSQAGIAEFARQFLLVKRREQYQKDGIHRLWFQWGGSAGHQGAMVLEANTGTHESGVRWDPELITEFEWKQRKAESRRIARDSAVEERVLLVVEYVGENPMCGSQDIRNGVPGRTSTTTEAIRLSVESGKIEERRVGHRKKFVLPGHEPVKSGDN